MLCSLLAYAPPLRLRVLGPRRVPRSGPVLVVCTHVAFIDAVPVAVACAPRRVWTMGKAPLFRNPLLGPVLARLGGFPVRRDHPDVWAIRTGRDILARGGCLVVFPEGGVTRSGLLGPGYAGAGYLSLRPGVRVIPAAIWGTQLMRGPVRIRFGPEIDMDDLRAGPRPGRNRRAAERIMAHLAPLVPGVGGPAQPPPTGRPVPRGQGPPAG
ncbi:MAG: 1-acyl-sn-glycerol-3-phosphate acyltransferase [Thermoleophilia bacterium]|nr:1-acyl-sn-glycerol-3-phosphate acyltransferase [Thermoleophilia bacterium]